jgi:hypothetical protein
VEGKLHAKSITWKDITIVKGRDPGLTSKGGSERYYAELQALLGIGRLALHAWSDVEPRPMWASRDIMPDPDATARTMWATFMDESSYGLSVSAFPRFVIPDVDGYSTLQLPAEAVLDPKRWDGITAVVREQLDYWKGTLQERIERLGKAKRRSAEDADQLKRDKATLKELQVFDGWTYQGFVEAMLPGRKPDPRDLDNLRLYRLSNGQLIPIMNLNPDQLRVDFWRRLLRLWDEPADMRADLVRGFLDHHHLTGGKAEVFRDLVKDTAARLRSLVGKGASLRDAQRWGLLADKLEGWLSDAPQRLRDEIHRAKPKDQSAWRNLKSLALFHAYRVEAGEDEADINPSNAQQVAHDAGFSSRSSGKTLLENFRKYAHGLPEHKQRERTRDGRPGDVARRFNDVIPRLAEYPDALRLAEADRAFLRTRSNESED